MGMGFDGGLTLSMTVSDLDQAIEWYRDTLGLELIYKVDEIAWAEMKSPVERVNIGLGAGEEKARSGNTVPTFGVSDIAASKAHLEGKGVRLDGDIQEYPGMVKLLTFYDRDDNALMLYQDLSEEG